VSSLFPEEGGEEGRNIAAVVVGLVLDSVIRDLCRLSSTGLFTVKYLDLYSGDAEFESQPGHRLSWLRLFVVFRSAAK
jgi:hypothetical protein